MDSLWPWLAVAATGALHGLNPAAGWVFVAWGGQGRARVLQALAPVALGHLAAVGLVAVGVPAALQRGFDVDRSTLQWLAASMMLLLVAHHFHCRTTANQTPGRLPVLLWSFAMGTAHGAGWMLLPALASWCGSDLPARDITASGSLLLACAALGVHLAAMIVTMAVMVAGASAARRWLLAA